MKTLKQMRRVIILLGTLFITLSVCGQTETMNEAELPYRVIPEHPDQLSAQNVLGRMIDGLGYRYYWATEGLRAQDLAYMPGGGGKSCAEQIEHIYDLSVTILNVAQGKPNLRGGDQPSEF